MTKQPCSATRVASNPRAGCWAPRGEKLAILQTSGRKRINIHGAVDLETRQPSAGYSNRLRLLEHLACFARMIEAETVDAASTTRLLESIEALYPLLAVIHVFLDNARTHHPPDRGPGVVREWRAQPGRRVVLHFIPPYCPLMSLSNDEPDRAAVARHAQACDAQQMLRHMRRIRGRNAQLPARESSEKRGTFHDSVTDNFRIISPKGFRVVT